MKKILLMGIVMFLLVLPFVLAEPSLFYKQNSDIDLKVACFNNNYALCDASTNCFITINYPNGTNLIENGTMSKRVSFYNYSMGSLEETGVYKAVTYCEATDNGFTEFEFEVNPTGKERINLIPLAILLSVLAVLFIFIGLIFFFRGRTN